MPVTATQRADEFAAGGDGTVALLQRLVHAGNVRRIWIKDERGRTLIEIPSTLGIRGGTFLMPIWAAVGALARMAGKLTIVVQREEAWPPYED